MRNREHLDAVIKAYDVRGVVGKDIDEDFVRDTAAAYAAILRSEGESTLAIGHDMRPSSPALAQAFAEGATSQGIDVILLGLTSTDELYYASGDLGCAGAMFTASHNPARYNGIKLCRAGARPVGQETGLSEIKDMLVNGVPEYSGKPGTISEKNVLDGYAAFLNSLVDLSDIR
ncbi:MAG: phosphomannomutase/phosphoglucomutase, partial [Corynebacterium flavescens]|nr:phosphomannomutase/phosphoglucomutase [Corynebacterium flavescens]